jgi:hypothetical protein
MTSIADTVRRVMDTALRAVSTPARTEPPVYIGPCARCGRSLYTSARNNCMWRDCPQDRQT